MIQPGMYVCVRTGGWLAWLIRRACGNSQVNHAFIVIDDAGGIVEARPEGVRRGTLSEYAGAYAVANTAEPMTASERASVAATAESFLNTPYNYPALVDLGLESIGWHWRWLMRLSKADKLLICSQLVVDAGQSAIPPMNWMCGRASADQVTPADLAKRAGVEPVAIT